ncbi:MAG TPA: zf-HC2 domain-containing protein [Bryobacteraceae bacterium]|nr:zf-HC2 domain-containing protein [Bryobacteraceae bacterium]
MSCENVQKLISPLVDRQVPAGEQEDVLAHLEACKQCGAQFESMQKMRQALRTMSHAPIPVHLTANLRVLASHERERRLSRVSFSARLRFWYDHARLWFDNLMRPVALPFGGGLVSAIVLFSILVPSLTFQHEDTDAVLVTDPYGQVVVLSSGGVYAPDGTTSNDLPRIEPTYAHYTGDYPEDTNVVWLAIGGDGKVQGYSVAKGRLTPDMISIISISKFSPATFLGLPTAGVVKMVQHRTRHTVRS